MQDKIDRKAKPAQSNTLLDPSSTLNRELLFVMTTCNSAYLVINITESLKIAARETCLHYDDDCLLLVMPIV